MDARDLKFDDASFDTIIDKGCFDAVSCAVDSKSNAIDVMNSVYRTLRPGGKFVVRTKHFCNCGHALAHFFDSFASIALA